MLRHLAANYLRKRLDENGLRDWHVRMVADLTKPFVGMTFHTDKTIVLNTFHVDTHPDVEVYDTINHEIAHALVGPTHGHDDVWAAKARELGCRYTLPCMPYGFNEEAIEAVRSNANLEVTFEERVIPEQVIRTPVYKTSRFQEKCPTCGKIAKEKSRSESLTKHGRVAVITLECLHVIFKTYEATKPYHELVFDGDKNCKHVWDKSKCLKCGAKQLYPFQVKGAEEIERNNGKFAIFDEMGLGKTIQILAYLYYNQDKAFPYLWVTKSGIKYQHAKEIVRVLGKDHFPQVFVKGGDTPIPGMSGYLIGYDLFRRLDLSIFDEMKIQTVFLDECQAIKNPESSRTQSIRAAVRDIPRILLASGTPWKNRGSEFYVALNLLDPVQFYSHKSFVKKWVEEYKDEKGKTKEGGILNPAKFKEATAHILIRRERKEVLPELPMVNRTRLVTELSEFTRAAYEKEKKTLTDIFNTAVIGGMESSFEVTRKLNESIMVMKQIIGIAKVPATIDFAQEFLEETDRKLLIFVHHKECMRQIYEQMKEWCATEGYPEPLQLTADMDAIERFEAQEKFNSSNHRLMVLSTLASGEGLNLQTCSDAVMHERQWNPANEEQAEGRMIRIGQMANNVNVTYIHADNTVDTTFDAIIEGKRLIFHQAMNKGQMPTWNESSIMKELIAALVGKKAA